MDINKNRITLKELNDKIHNIKGKVRVLEYDNWSLKRDNKIYLISIIIIIFLLIITSPFLLPNIINKTEETCVCIEQKTINDVDVIYEDDYLDCVGDYETKFYYCDSKEDCQKQLERGLEFCERFKFDEYPHFKDINRTICVKSICGDIRVLVD